MSLKFNVLQVEDNAGDTLLLRRALTRSGAPLKLHSTSTGEEAVDLLLGSSRLCNSGTPSFSAVLLDLNLPGMSGPDVLRRIDQAPALNHVKVALLTSAADTRGYDMTGLEHRVSKHYRKPTSPVGYVAIVEHLLELLTRPAS